MAKRENMGFKRHFLATHVHLLVIPHRRNGAPRFVKAGGRSYVHQFNHPMSEPERCGRADTRPASLIPSATS
jgi:hypothetical protein